MCRKILLVVGLLFVSSTAVGQISRERPTEQFTPNSRSATPADMPNPAEVQQEIVTLTNQFRTQQGRPEVKGNAQLAETANAFAQFMAHTDKYGHTADGKQPWDRAAEHGYDYCLIEENIAELSSSEKFTARQLAEEFVHGWEQSPGHRKNMLNPDVTETGVGVARSSQSGKVYAVQMFGRPRSAAVSVSIANETNAPVEFTLNGNKQTLRPEYTVTYRQCRPPEIRFHLKGAPETPFRPKSSARYVIREKESGAFSVEER